MWVKMWERMGPNDKERKTRLDGDGNEYVGVKRYRQDIPRIGPGGKTSALD